MQDSDPEERAKLQAFIDTLEANQERDPKVPYVLDILLHQTVARRGLHHLLAVF